MTHPTLVRRLFDATPVGARRLKLRRAERVLQERMKKVGLQFWFDEASTLSVESWRKLKPSQRPRRFR
jgi:hypothetical protein